MSEHSVRSAIRSIPAVSLLFLAACMQPVREPDPAAPELAAPPAPIEAAADAGATPPPSEAPADADPAPAAPAPAVEPSLWQSIVARYAFSECSQPSPAVRRWQRIYAQSPTRHAAELARAAPWIGYVADELARRELPAEFVWLPFVESRYQPFRSRGDRPAGVWQLMPATARWRGLRIRDGYDGRLDFVAATDAALDLIEHLAQSFDRDWALVTMAYNAGEFRIKGALQRARTSTDATPPERLAVSPITHEHLVKLRALACLVATPEQMGLALPAFERAHQMQSLRVDRQRSVAQLIALLGIQREQWQSWNPAWSRGRVDAGAEILLPQQLVQQGLRAIEAAAPEAFAATTPAAGADRVHVVRNGESAWGIARRYAVSLSALLAANALAADAVLHPGQRLRLP